MPSGNGSVQKEPGIFCTDRNEKIKMLRQDQGRGWSDLQERIWTGSIKYSKRISGYGIFVKNKEKEIQI